MKSMKNYLSNWNTKYMPSIFRFTNNLYCWICNNYELHENFQQAGRSFISFWNLKSRSFTCSHLLKVVVTRCHFLSLVVPVGFTRCDSLYHLLLFVVTGCHLLWFVVPLVLTRRCFLHQSVSLVVTHCTTSCHSLSLVVICCLSLYHSLSLVVSQCRSVFL